MVFYVNHPTQVAIEYYLRDPKHYQKLSTFYQAKRDLFLEAISTSRFTFVPTQGSYFQLLDYTAISDQGDVEFARQLTIDYKIASIPISVFMNGKDPRKLRFCFAKEDHELLKAAQILNRL